MSRLTSMSANALKAVFSPDSDSDLITLLTIYDPVNTNNILARISDGYTTRISENANEVLYGVTRTVPVNPQDPQGPQEIQNFIFLPVQITLPSEEEAQAPRCSLSISDVTRYLTPIIRNLQEPPRVKLELILNKSPYVSEISFDYLYISNISYNRDVVNCDLTMINLEREPFPLHSFTPANFPGLF